MNIHRKNVLSIAVLVAAAASPLTALASDQLGASATQWFEESQFPAATGWTVFSSTGFYHDSGEALATANVTRGAGPLSTIGGPSTRNNACLNNNADVDMYTITITDPANFSVVCNSSPTCACLYLFNAGGTAIAGYQNYLTSGGVAATLAAGVASGFSVGDIAYLAITRDSTQALHNHPLNNAGLEIFPLAAGAVLPDPTVSDHVLGLVEGPSVVPGNWSNTGGDSFGLFAQSYTLTLSAGYATTPAPAPPASSVWADSSPSVGVGLERFPAPASMNDGTVANHQ